MRCAADFPQKFLFALLLLLSPSILRAQEPVPYVNLWSLFGQMPPEIKKELKGGKADANGMVSHNQPIYLGAEYQRGGMDTLLAGIFLRDTSLIDEGFRVANITFMKQVAGGGFGDKDPTGAAFWVTACARTFLALKESEYWPEYQTQTENYYSALGLASSFLVNNVGKLIAHDKHTPNRLLIDADALYLTAKLLGTDPPPEAAKLRDMALALFDKDTGAFEENGGGDSSCQAVNLLMLMYDATYYPSPDLDIIIRQGLDWELSKVNAEGGIDVKGNSRSGAEKEVNIREVCLMFAYAGALYHDDNYTQTAVLIHQNRFNHQGHQVHHADLP
jgi:hypothetical protein